MGLWFVWHVLCKTKIQLGNLCNVISTTCEVVITIYTSHDNCSASMVTSIYNSENGKNSVYRSSQVTFLVCTISAKHSIVSQTLKLSFKYDSVASEDAFKALGLFDSGS